MVTCLHVRHINAGQTLWIARYRTRAAQLLSFPFPWLLGAIHESKRAGMPHRPDSFLSSTTNNQMVPHSRRYTRDHIQGIIHLDEIEA